LRRPRVRRLEMRERCGGGTGEPAWVLDHDYLCRAVVEAERRSNRWRPR
jgi:hypothetical protein